MKRTRGFTLIEVMIVVAIVAIVAIMATMNFKTWFSHYGAVDFQREFLSQVNEARTRSMSSSLQHRLLLDLDAERFTLQRGNAGTGSSVWADTRASITAERAAGFNDITYTPGPLTLSTGARAIIFNPGGQVLIQTNPADNTTVSLFNEADVHLTAESAADLATVRVFGWTSKARLFNGW